MQKEKKKFYQTKWFLWLCLILFPPVGIILIWSIHKEMKSKTKIILSIVFALWFAILMISTQGAKDGFEDGMKETPPTKQEESEPTKEVTKQNIEDASLSFFTDIVMNAYDEIPRGAGQENGVEIDSTNLSTDLKSGEATVSYTLEEAPYTGANVAITFNVDGERIGVSEILIDGVSQEVPDDAKESVLIWLLLDVNYQG